MPLYFLKGIESVLYLVDTYKFPESYTSLFFLFFLL